MHTHTHTVALCKQRCPVVYLNATVQVFSNTHKSESSGMHATVEVILAHAALGSAPMSKVGWDTQTNNCGDETSCLSPRAVVAVRRPMLDVEFDAGPSGLRLRRL